MKIDPDAASKNQADSDDESECAELKNLHMSKVVYKYESSECSSSSDGSVSNRLSPIPDDANSKSYYCYYFLTFTSGVINELTMNFHFFSISDRSN